MNEELFNELCMAIMDLTEGMTVADLDEIFGISRERAEEIIKIKNKIPNDLKEQWKENF